MQVFSAYFAWAVLMANAAAAFMQSAQHESLKKMIHPSSHQSCAIHNPIVLHQSETEDIDDEEYEDVEFVVTAEQIMALRKEAAKRERRKDLPRFFLPLEDSAQCSQEKLEEIVKLFDTNELIQIKGVSKDKKKHVFDVAHTLAATLEEEMGKPVVVVDIKGFAVKLYSPWWEEDQDGTSKIQLYCSYRPNQWARKAKALRDERGQVIVGEDGKSIKVIPE